MTLSSKVIGFFGFKGGLGRTVSAVAAATTLAEQGRRVLLIDGDLEAPGLSLSAAYSDVLMDRPGLIQLLLGDLDVEVAVTNAPAVTASGLTRKPALDGGLRLLGAGTKTSASGRGINTRALGEAMDSLSASVSYEGSLERVEERWNDLVHRLKDAHDIDVVILDMRTGFSQFTGMMMRSCDVAVFMCGLNQQNILGTASILRDLGDSAPRAVLLASSPVPSSATKGLAESWKMFNEAFEPIRPHGQPLIVEGRPRLSLPYSPILAVTDDPTKYVRELDLVSAFSDFTNALRDALGIGVSNLLSELRTQMSEPDNATTTAAMCRLLVELARINGLQDTLAREGQGWHMPSVPVTLARALADAVDVLRSLDDEISDELILEVAKLWVYKLRFSRPSPDSERVLNLYQTLIRRLDVEGWSPRDARGQPARLIGRMRVDYADAILHHQRHRVVNHSESVDLDALAIAERELRQLRIDLVGPGTLIWCAQVITHLVRLIPEQQLMERLEDGVTRVKALAAFAEDLLARSKGASGHATWSEYVVVGLAIAWPTVDSDEQQRRVKQAIALTHMEGRYRERGRVAASYDRAILYHRLGNEVEAHKALEVLRYDDGYREIAKKDPDLLDLRDYIKQNFPSQQSAAHF